MNIFCLFDKNNTSNPKKILLSQDLQSELKSLFDSFVQEMSNLEEITFSGQYKLDDNQIFFIDNFTNSHNEIDSLLCENLDDKEIDNIKFLIFVEDNKIAYQCFDTRKIIKPNRWYLLFDSNTYSKIDKKGLIIDDKIDALYFEKDKKLLFKSFHNASKIFDLSKYFREATDNEIKKFLKHQIFDNTSDIPIDIFDNLNLRKKIFLIINNNCIDIITNNFDKAFRFAERINLQGLFDKENNKIKFPTDKRTIDKLIRFINEDFYLSEISNEIYLTNSKVKISSTK